MPANLRTGNIMQVRHGIIVHQVNAQGVMGSGIAALIKAWYPKHFEDYVDQLKEWKGSGLKDSDILGRIIISQFSGNFGIIAIVGQQYYGREPIRYTSYDALDVGFAEVAKIAKIADVPVHYPKIGCGLGGGDWTIVSAIIEKNLGTIDHTFWDFQQPR